MRTSFVLVRSDLSSEEAIKEVTAKRASHVIVDRVDIPGYFYLMDLKEMLKLLRAASPEAIVRIACDLHEEGRTDVRDASLPEPFGRRFVLLDAGRPVGFLDPAPIGRLLSQSTVESAQPRAAPTRSTRSDLRTANGGGAGGGAAGPRPPLIRYPDLEYPDEVVLNKKTSLTVSLLLAPRVADASAPIVIQDQADEPPEVDVVVRARGFTILNANTEPLVVLRDADCSVRFKLIPKAEGAQTIHVDFYKENRRIGTATCSTNIVPQPSEAPATVPPPVTEPLELSATGLDAPDLALFIDVAHDNERELSFTLHSALANLNCHHLDVGTVFLKEGPMEKFRAVYTELSKYAGAKPATPAGAKIQRERLARWGEALWHEVIPDVLKVEYWRLKDQVRSLLITSEEPWIPWEIIKPYREDAQGVRVQEAPHFCESFSMGRWLSPSVPVGKLRVRNVRPVAALSTNLASVKSEIEYIERLDEVNAAVRPDAPYHERTQVIDLFKDGDFSIMHFAAHGSFDQTLPDISAIRLSDGALAPIDITGRFAGARTRPLIFINACHGAAMGYAFTNLGGWAEQLVEKSRVGAFVGASWEVNDTLALQFAKVFYKALLSANPSGSTKTIGEAFREAREAIRIAQPENSTWLAYVLYADPMARAVTGA